MGFLCRSRRPSARYHYCPVLILKALAAPTSSPVLGLQDRRTTAPPVNRAVLQPLVKGSLSYGHCCTLRKPKYHNLIGIWCVQLMQLFFFFFDIRKGKINSFRFCIGEFSLLLYSFVSNSIIRFSCRFWQRLGAALNSSAMSRRSFSLLLKAFWSLPGRNSLCTCSIFFLLQQLA